MILDNERNGETIAEHIGDMYRNDSLRADMQRASRGMGTVEACSRIVDIADSLLKNSPVKKAGKKRKTRVTLSV